MELLRALCALALALPALACTDSDDGATPEWTLVRSPEFVTRPPPSSTHGRGHT